MRAALLAALAGCVVGCSHPVVIVIPGQRIAAADASAPRVPATCRYTTMAITHSMESYGMSRADIELSARISEVMRSEFARLGADVTQDPAGAYWSLMVIAATDARHYEGFVFSATLSLRQLSEGRDPGIMAYTSKDSEGTPTAYSGLGYGPGYELDRTVRSFVARADAALLPAVRALCRAEEGEHSREAEAENLVPRPVPL